MSAAAHPAIALLRPWQWSKNAFVFVGVLFVWAWDDYDLVARALVAFVAFSLVASAVYIFNDFSDRDRDRLHPRKRFRPLAAGTVGAATALTLLVVTLVPGMILGWWISGAAFGLLLTYVALNVAYSRFLNQVVILDVFLIATGFMLRILVGTTGLGIAPSRWLLLCGLMLSLFIGFAKRRAELAEVPGDAGTHRAVLGDYSPALLDKFIAISASAVVIAYGLYTVDSTTVQTHGTDELIYTLPFVLYGVFRFLFLLHRKGGGGDPAAMILRDRHLLLSILLWLLTVVWVLSGNPGISPGPGG